MEKPVKKYKRFWCWFWVIWTKVRKKRDSERIIEPKPVEGISGRPFPTNSKHHLNSSKNICIVNIFLNILRNRFWKIQEVIWKLNVGETLDFASKVAWLWEESQNFKWFIIAFNCCNFPLSLPHPMPNLCHTDDSAIVSSEGGNVRLVLPPLFHFDFHVHVWHCRIRKFERSGSGRILWTCGMQESVTLIHRIRNLGLASNLASTASSSPQTFSRGEVWWKTPETEKTCTVVCNSNFLGFECIERNLQEIIFQVETCPALPTVLTWES